MSKIFEKSEANSSNMNDITIESEFKISSFYNKITSKYNNSNKKNIFNRRKSIPATYRKIHILNNYNQDIMNYSKSTNQSEENKTKLFLKENKENQANSLFNNSFLREKQKRFRLSSTNMNNYHIYLDCDKKNNTFNIVDNNNKMLNAFLSQTKSNFNNKYNIIYSVSDWRKKEEISKLFNAIKKNQNKYNFSIYLENKINKRCSSAKRIKFDNNLTSKNNSNSNILILNQSNNFLENIYHRNNLIKVKTVNYVSGKPDKSKKRNVHIFDSNNMFFKTMPFKNKK